MKGTGWKLALVAASVGSLVSARRAGAEATFNDVIRDWSSLHLQDSRSVEGLRLSVGHAHLDLVSGQAAYVLAGREVVGIYFRGEGKLEYATTDPTEVPAVRWNVRQNTGLKPEETGSSLTLRDRFAEVLWLVGGETLPELQGASVGRALDQPFAKHRAKFGRRGGTSIEAMFTLWRFNATDRRLVYAEVAGGNVDVVYDFDDAIDKHEELLALLDAPAGGALDAKSLEAVCLSERPLGRDPREPLVPEVLMSHVDVALTATGDRDVTISATGTFSAVSAELRALRLYLASQRRLSEGVEQRQLSLPLQLKGVYDESGNHLPFSHKQDTLIVGLLTPMRPGTPMKLRFEIEGAILHRPEGNDYWELGDEAWFPQPAWAAQIYTARCVVRVQRPFTPLASGVTISRTVDGDFNVLETRADKPIRGLTVLAGKYYVTEETLNGTTIRLVSYGQKNPVGSAKLMKLVRGLVEYYSGFLGPFPFSEFNVVGKTEAFFMIETRPGFLLVNQALFGPALGGKTVRFQGGTGKRVARGIASQYWGQAVKAASPEEWWVTEGFAEMSAALAIRDLQRPSDFEEIRKGWRSNAKKATDVAPIPLAHRLHGAGAHKFTYDLLFAKGAWLLDSIRRELGERPFLVFLSSCQATSLWKLGRAKTVLAVLEAVSKRPWDSFFEASYWGTGMPGEPGRVGPGNVVQVVAPAVPQGAPARSRPAPGTDVEAVLERLLELKDAGFEEELMIAWLQKNRPARPLTAEEMIAWKKAGVPPGVIREAMK